jgi:hypothetical protein
MLHIRIIYKEIGKVLLRLEYCQIHTYTHSYTHIYTHNFLYYILEESQKFNFFTLGSYKL